MGANAGGNSLPMASISPLRTGMINKFVTRGKDGGEGRSQSGLPFYCVPSRRRTEKPLSASRFILHRVVRIL